MLRLWRSRMQRPLREHKRQCHPLRRSRHYNNEWVMMVSIFFVICIIQRGGGGENKGGHGVTDAAATAATASSPATNTFTTNPTPDFEFSASSPHFDCSSHSSSSLPPKSSTTKATAKSKKAASCRLSSARLQLQNRYDRHPPHDTALYDTLHVPANATAEQITRSYRRLCRLYHPDKKQHDHADPHDDDHDYFDAIQSAYTVLKDDTTRCVYHQYGVRDSAQAVQILTGQYRPCSCPSSTTESRNSYADLLRLMGYDPGGTTMFTTSTSTHMPAAPDRMMRMMGGGGGRERERVHAELQHPHPQPQTQQFMYYERIARMASHVLEQLRVVIEGIVEEQVVLEAVQHDCAALKRVPLGAHILRCVGRAYRHSGQKALLLWQQQQQRPNNIYSSSFSTARRVSQQHTNVRERFRDMKHWADAAFASGRAWVAEYRLETHHKKKKQQQQPHTRRKIPCGEEEEDDDDNNNNNNNDDDDEAEVANEEWVKTHATRLASLQVEALWKVTKIELDQIVRQACEVVLTGGYFYAPTDRNQNLDGWIGGTLRNNGDGDPLHDAVHMSEGLRRAAELLIKVGDIMVEQSKQGTAWME